MSQEKRKYDSTVARIAGNIAGHMIDDVRAGHDERAREIVAQSCVALARAIVAEVERTEIHEITNESGTQSPHIPRVEPHR